MASIIMEAMKGKVSINLGVLMALIGWGLLKLNPNSYRWAKFCCQAALWLIPLILVLAITSPSVVTIKMFSLPLSNVPGEVKLALTFFMCAFGFGVALWQLRVLQSEPVRWVFLTPGEQYIASLSTHG